MILAKYLTKFLLKKCLAMALQLMCFWQISNQSPDSLPVYFTPRYHWIVAWEDSHFSFCDVIDVHADSDLSDNTEPYLALKYLVCKPIDPLKSSKINIPNGFTYQNGTASGYRFRAAILPCWSIVIPLTLLSAWLLLSKPGIKSTAQKAPEAI